MLKVLTYKVRRYGHALCSIMLIGTTISCSSEIGRIPTDTDISCLRKQMAAPMYLSFPIAANECQKMTNHGVIFGEKHAKPIPLHLKKAPDLQKLAEEYHYSYITTK